MRIIDEFPVLVIDNKQRLVFVIYRRMSIYLLIVMLLILFVITVKALNIHNRYIDASIELSLLKSSYNEYRSKSGEGVESDSNIFLFLSKINKIKESVSGWNINVLKVMKDISEPLPSGARIEFVEYSRNKSNVVVKVILDEERSLVNYTRMLERNMKSINKIVIDQQISSEDKSVVKIIISVK
ncbi:MAG: hypothetical protein OEV64_02420 [Desulfobulbaceae bacterium]|nr:hypothetical protein [Desulfobulbaceae bacterium]